MGPKAKPDKFRKRGVQTRMRLLGRASLPRGLLKLIFFMYINNHVDLARDLDVVEFFAGQKTIAREASRRGLRSESYEILDDPVNQDILAKRGFIRAISLILRLKPGGCAHLGIVCSSRIWMKDIGEELLLSLRGSNQGVREA